MYYYIMTSPPGYPANENFMVGAYRSKEFDSCIGHFVGKKDRPLFGTLEDARHTIPGDPQRLDFEPKDQFIELWESVDPLKSPSFRLRK